MKKVLFTVSILFLLSAMNSFPVEATFPGENIIFGNRGQSNEQSNETLVRIFKLATKKNTNRRLL